MAQKKRGLARGLDSFMMETPLVQDLIEENQDRGQDLPLEDIKINPLQPRKHFDPESLEELAGSIKEVGVLQPLIVRKKKNSYLLVAGERRLRAAKLAGLDQVPVIVTDLDDKEADKIALIENIQREDLDPLEEAQAYEGLKSAYGYTQEEMARALGKSRPYIANRLRLLNLAEPVKDLLREKKISVSHAKALLAIGDPNQQYAKALEIIKKNSTVNELEKKVSKKPRKTTRDPYIRSLEDQLMDRLGTKVDLKNQGKKRKLTIEYYSDEDLDRILEIIMGGDSIG
ncbi:MAG: ParB/RepB/Spo0J family partition protein [Tissierellia bacterium]|nr:ParB/RepB/Spo0J family partition protein [Tissierellia bacterium]